MSVNVEAYLIISAINLSLMLSGGLLASHYYRQARKLAQWRPNKPVQAQKTP